jgi:SAM-dependent methyltransferase
LSEGYRDDLARVHDEGFGRFAEGAAGVLLGEIRRRRGGPNLVVDLGCGSGILAEIVTRRGFDVLGVDLSPAMLRIARERAPKARFRQDSLWDAEIPPCLGATMIGECVNYLFDASGARKRFRELLARIHAALAPGGVLLFDAAGPGRVPPPGRLKNFWESEHWSVLVEAVEDGRRKTLTRTITTFRKVGDLYRRDREVHRLRLTPREEIAADLRAAGFRFKTLRRCGETELPPGHVRLSRSEDREVISA